MISLVRDLDNPQKFQLEYENGDIRTYVASERDAILTALIDGARGSGNYQLYVMSKRISRNFRLLPLNYLLDEESEVTLMKHIINCPREIIFGNIRLYTFKFLAGLSRSLMIQRFNANIPYNGLSYSASSEVCAHV